MALFPTYDAPKYKYGYQVLVLFGVLAVVGYLLLYVLQEKRRKVAREDQENLEERIES